MHDSEIVAAIAAGDPDGLAAAYDRYAAPLHAFCCSLLTDRADAADCVQDTFFIAAGCLDGLRDPDLLKPWLYAVARNQGHRRLAARTSGAAPAEVNDDTADLGIDLERAELREVVRSALASLSPADREIAEMSLRQEFADEDLALVLGVSVSQARMLAARAREHYTTALGVLLVARSGRSYCLKLDELLEDWNGGHLDELLRQRLAKHIKHCRICGERKKNEVPGALLLSVLPAVAIARGLRPQVLELVGLSSADTAAYRAGVVAQAAPFADNGFPVPLDVPRTERRGRRAVLLSGVAAGVAAVCAFGAIAVFGGGHSPQTTAADSLNSNPGTSSSPDQPAVSSTSPLGTKSPSATHRAAATVSTSAVPTDSPTPGATQPAESGHGGGGGASPGRSSQPPGSSSPTPPSSSSPPPVQGTLSVSPAGVVLSASGGDPTGSFTVTAVGGAVTFTVSVPSEYAEDLIVSPATETLADGQSATINVTWDSTTSMSTILTVGPTGVDVSVSYTAPTGNPTSSPSPTPDPSSSD